MKRIALFSLIILTMLFTVALSATAEIIDDDPDAIALYTRGKRQMSEGAWLEAAATFQQLAGQFPNSRNMDLFLFNRAKAEYHFGKYAEAIAGFEFLTSRYKQSEVIPAAYYFLGNAYYRHGELYSALLKYFYAFEYVRHSRLRDQVVAAINATITNAASVRPISTVSREAGAVI
jgi:outer membrane protein assembly factor BamD (BamD/ComL family)